jgi:hypothetical protein
MHPDNKRFVKNMSDNTAGHPQFEVCNRTVETVKMSSQVANINHMAGPPALKYTPLDRLLQEAPPPPTHTHRASQCLYYTIPKCRNK